MTIARLGIGRAGWRYPTSAMLQFRADHAAARDAVHGEVSDETLAKLDLFSVTTEVDDKEEFLSFPERGRHLSAEARKAIIEKCEKSSDVQVVVIDGLSSLAIEQTVPLLLPGLLRRLDSGNKKIGTPFFVRHGRVAVQDEIGELLNAKVVVALVGERPGLATAESLGAYIVYKPHKGTTDAQRSLISSIHGKGSLPSAAVDEISLLIERILQEKASGVDLNADESNRE